MPSGPKRRRAQKKKNEAAAAREKAEIEAPLTASSKENSPVMQTERTDGVTAGFDEPTVVLPRRTVLLENMLASEVLDLKRKDTEEGTKENVLPAEIYWSVQSLSIAEPLEKSPDDKINVVGESSAVAAPYVIVLDSEDEDGDSMMSPDVCDLEGKDTEGTIDNSVPTKACSSVLVTERPVMTDNAVISLTTKPCDLDLVAVECSNAQDAVLTDLHASEDQKTLKHKENRVAVENKETATPNEVDAPERSESVQVNEVEAAMKNQEAAVSEYVNVIEKKTTEAVAENQETAAANEVDAPENTKAVQEGEMEVAVKNQKAAMSEDVNDSEKSTIKAVALWVKFETIPNNLEAVVAAKPAVDIIYQTQDAVSTELVKPEVEKQLKEIKEMVEEVLNRLNALLHRN